ncbi:hypothetical protein BH10BAC5_BH10BAC5_21780 [soil metagenome]
MKLLVKNAILMLLLTYAFSLNAQVKDATLVIGEFKISKVTDGDTFRFEGLDKSTRLLGIDTEETFKSADAQQKTSEISRDWPKFYYEEKGKHDFPVKTDTPMGYDAWIWAKDYVEDFDHVRLELENKDRVIDVYGRYLVYIILIRKDGTEVNYNIECVKQGYSPYFNKYGNSERFHQEFIDAQDYAIKNKLGIWSDKTMHYPDYPQRLEWWNKRAQQILDYNAKHKGDPKYFDMNEENDYNRLADNVGKEVIIFSSVGLIKKDKYPNLIPLSFNDKKVINLVIFENKKELLEKTNMNLLREYYIYAKGKLQLYKDKYEIVLYNKDQVWIE